MQNAGAQTTKIPIPSTRASTAPRGERPNSLNGAVGQADFLRGGPRTDTDRGLGAATAQSPPRTPFPMFFLIVFLLTFG